MFSADELRTIPLFSTLADEELRYLAGAIADIHLLPGEYVVHEGEGRALIVTVEGRLEVTKIIDGIERVVGVRTPGDLFGEVPVVLNTPFLASLRAIEPSRIARIEIKDFHTIAAAAPEISEKVGASALDRIEGLQDIAAEPPRPQLLVIGQEWDPHSHTLRSFLHRNQVEFDWLIPENSLAAPVLEQVGADLRYPIVRLSDGALLVNPRLPEIARAVGLSIAPQSTEYDVVIIGGGPAGLPIPEPTSFVRAIEVAS